MDENLIKMARKRKPGSGKMTPEELKAAKRLAEKMKGSKDVDNPQAMARWMAGRGAKPAKG